MFCVENTTKLTSDGNSLGSSVVVDSKLELPSTSIDESNEEELPESSWFKAATILLSLKTATAKTRGSATHNAAGFSNAPWLPCSPPCNLNYNDEATNANQIDGYSCHDNNVLKEQEHCRPVLEKLVNQSNEETIHKDETETSYHDVDENSSTMCSLCHKVYSRPSTLKAHMRVHTGEKPFKCSICDKAFSQNANLKAHFRVHSKEKPFKCRICHRRFAQSSSVTTHMRIHSGERPHKCKVCSQEFACSSTLTKHLRVHTGEKPYQCRVCDMRFSQSGNLSRHVRIHKRN